MIIIRTLLFIFAILFTVNVHAECTLQTAQTKMIESTNMMQVYNRQRVTYIEQTKTVPEDFERQFTAFDDRKNELVTQFGKETDANPNIGFNDPISQSLCDGFDELFAKYAPSGYAKEEVSLKPTSSDPNCTSNGLWTKYGKLIQKQTAMSKAGKFTDAESADMMRLSTEIGTTATTDLTKACSLMNDFEKMLSTK